MIMGIIWLWTIRKSNFICHCHIRSVRKRPHLTYQNQTVRCLDFYDAQSSGWKFCFDKSRNLCTLTERTCIHLRPREIWICLNFKNALLSFGKCGEVQTSWGIFFAWHTDSLSFPNRSSEIVASDSSAHVIIGHEFLTKCSFSLCGRD